MHRWARVTMNQSGFINDGRYFWINESNVSFIADNDGGSIVGFSTSEDDVINVHESCDEIFTEWDEWQAIQEGSD